MPLLCSLARLGRRHRGSGRALELPGSMIRHVPKRSDAVGSPQTDPLHDRRGRSCSDGSTRLIDQANPSNSVRQLSPERSSGCRGRRPAAKRSVALAVAPADRCDQGGYRIQSSPPTGPISPGVRAAPPAPSSAWPTCAYRSADICRPSVTRRTQVTTASVRTRTCPRPHARGVLNQTMWKPRPSCTTPAHRWR
jgi:hypothetical protein